MLIELAVGDAYGAGFEYVDAEIVARRNNLTAYLRRHTETRVQGRYTDDTQMSLATAEAIVSGEAWTPENLAARFVECFHRDPRPGYAGRFYDFLRETKTGTQFLANIRPDSDKSGVAMRAAPVGVFGSLAEVKEKAAVQARLTHDTPAGVAAAQASALMSHYFLYGLGPKATLGAFLDLHVPGYTWNDPWRGKVGAKGWMSVRAAVTAVMAHESQSAILRACIAFTGDVDTVATIALASASCCLEVKPDLPANLFEYLENGRYGHDYIKELDKRLLALVVQAEE